MPSRVAAINEAAIQGRRLQADLCGELRNARLMRGLSQREVARAIGASHATISRVEHGHVKDMAIADLIRHGSAVGLRLHARFYPTGGGLRDKAQVDLLRRFRARLGDRWDWQLEAPLPLAGDLRAFDALLRNEQVMVAVEAITRLHDAQAQLRAAQLKQRDGHADRLVILLNASESNRHRLRSAIDLLAMSFPLSTRATLAALKEGQDPGDNGIVLL
jgi:transcriptional regulator with XRE-family HTH domain